MPVNPALSRILSRTSAGQRVLEIAKKAESQKKSTSSKSSSSRSSGSSRSSAPPPAPSIYGEGQPLEGQGPGTVPTPPVTIPEADISVPPPSYQYGSGSPGTSTSGGGVSTPSAVTPSVTRPATLQEYSGEAQIGDIIAGGRVTTPSDFQPSKLSQISKPDTPTYTPPTLQQVEDTTLSQRAPSNLEMKLSKMSPTLSQHIHDTRMRELASKEAFQSFDTINRALPYNTTVKVSWQENGVDKTTLVDTRRIDAFQQDMQERGAQIYKITDYGEKTTYYSVPRPTDVQEKFVDIYPKYQSIDQPEYVDTTTWDALVSNYRAGNISRETLENETIRLSKSDYYQFVPNRIYIDIVRQQSEGILSPDEAAKKLQKINEEYMHQASPEQQSTWLQSNLTFGEEGLTFQQLQQQDPSIVDLRTINGKIEFIRDYEKAAKQAESKLMALSSPSYEPRLAVGTGILSGAVAGAHEGAGTAYRIFTGQAYGPEEEARRIKEAYDRERYEMYQAAVKAGTGEDKWAYAKKYATSPLVMDVAVPIATAGAFSFISPIATAGGRFAARRIPKVIKTGAKALAKKVTKTTVKTVPSSLQKVASYGYKKAKPLGKYARSIGPEALVGIPIYAPTVVTGYKEFTGKVEPGSTAKSFVRASVQYAAFRLGAKAFRPVSQRIDSGFRSIEKTIQERGMKPQPFQRLKAEIKDLYQVKGPNYLQRLKKGKYYMGDRAGRQVLGGQTPYREGITSMQQLQARSIRYGADTASRLPTSYETFLAEKYGGQAVRSFARTEQLGQLRRYFKGDPKISVRDMSTDIQGVRPVRGVQTGETRFIRERNVNLVPREARVATTGGKANIMLTESGQPFSTPTPKTNMRFNPSTQRWERYLRPGPKQTGPTKSISFKGRGASSDDVWRISGKRTQLLPKPPQTELPQRFGQVDTRNLITITKGGKTTYYDPKTGASYTYTSVSKPSNIIRTPKPPTTPTGKVSPSSTGGATIVQQPAVKTVSKTKVISQRAIKPRTRTAQPPITRTTESIPIEWKGVYDVPTTQEDILYMDLQFRRPKKKTLYPQPSSPPPPTTAFGQANDGWASISPVSGPPPQVQARKPRTSRSSQSRAIQQPIQQPKTGQQQARRERRKVAPVSLQQPKRVQRVSRRQEQPSARDIRQEQNRYMGNIPMSLQEQSQEQMQAQMQAQESIQDSLYDSTYFTPKLYVPPGVTTIETAPPGVPRPPQQYTPKPPLVPRKDDKEDYRTKTNVRVEPIDDTLWYMERKYHMKSFIIPNPSMRRNPYKPIKTFRPSIPHRLVMR